MPTWRAVDPHPVPATVAPRRGLDVRSLPFNAEHLGPPSTAARATTPHQLSLNPAKRSRELAPFRDANASGRFPREVVLTLGDVSGVATGANTAG